MFEEGGTYANRRGTYTVLEIEGPIMKVRFDDGHMAELNMKIQHRIWENIQLEIEAKDSRSRGGRNKNAAGTRFFIMPVTQSASEELVLTSMQRRLIVPEEYGQQLKQGDRLLYYAIDSQKFFAVATITGANVAPRPSDVLPAEYENVDFLVFPIDIDASSDDMDKAIAIDSVELESQKNARQMLSVSLEFLEITEDEFELIAELLTEIAEEEEEDLDLDDEDEEDEDAYDD